MPGITVPVRRSRESDDDSVSNDEGAVTSPGDATPSSQASNKRARLERDPPADVDDSWVLSPIPSASQPAANNRARSTAPARTSRDSGVALNDGSSPVQHEFKPGSIIRITLRNFVTYTKASFNFGPALNMVIGPNGTGKSTLVCAICLGLGWSPENLGRAKNPSEFVKNGCEEAMIEIELKGKPGSRNNPIIRRQIVRNTNKSEWSINGQKTNQKQVLNLAKSFAIQIDNLCQFLPQDRVVEFAAMGPKQLLDSTQRAAAEPQMSEWHEQLKTLRANQKKAEDERETQQNTLASLEKRQETQRGEVERMRERKDLADEVKMLEKCKIFVEYGEIRTKVRTAKDDLKAARDELAQLNAELEPSERNINAKQTYHDEIAKVIRGRKRIYQGLEDQFKNHTTKKNAVERRIDTIDARKAVAKRSFNDRKKEIARHERSLNTLRVQQQNPPPPFDPVIFNERMREKGRETNDVEARRVELVGQITTLKSQITNKSEAKERADLELTNLDTEEGQRELALRAMSKDTAEAWKFVKHNRHLFKGDVFGPPLISCNVTDPRYAACVEGLLQKNDYLSITCTDQDDFQTLSKELYDKQGLGHIALRVSTMPLSGFKPLVSQDEANRLEIDGWAIDYLSGPEPVLSVLCQERKLHCNAVRLQDSSEAHYEKMMATPVKNWITPKKRYITTERAEYGQAGVSTLVRDVGNATKWTKRAVNLDAQRQLRQQVAELTSEIAELEGEVEKLNKEKSSKIKQKEKIKAEADAIRDEKDELQKAVSAYGGLANKIDVLQTQLAELREAQRESRETENKIQDERTEQQLIRAQAAIDYGRTAESLREHHAGLILASITLIEAQSDLETLRLRNEEAETLRKQREEDVERIDKEFKEFREVARQKRGEIENIAEDIMSHWNGISEEDRNRWTLEDYEGELEQKKSRLDLLQSGNPRTIKEFEERAVRIEKLQADVAETQSALSTLEEDMATIRAQWEPRLDALIARISAAFGQHFAQMGCAGEVRIHRAGENGREYDDWAVQIHVKFRGAEQMSILDSHRQSGGERAVSTVFYLMALQSLSRAPFRVVDEINQGMDPRNERLVHERMVDIACGGYGGAAVEEGGGGGSQYFLITPKLLTGLKFRPGMMVHSIFSGEHVPEDPEELNLAKLVQRFKARAVEAAG